MKKLKNTMRLLIRAKKYYCSNPAISDKNDFWQAFQRKIY